MHAYKRTFLIPVGALGTDVDATVPIFRAPWDAEVVSVKFIPTGTLTGANANTRKHEVINAGQAGSGTAVVAELQYNSGVNAAAATPKTITNSATAANLDLTEGDVLTWKSTAPGTGIADPGGLVELVIQRIVD